VSTFKETALHESFFRPGSSLCPGCMEAIALNNIGRVSDNGVKTIFALGTSCAEVSTLAYPNVVAWGRGEQTSPDVSKSFGIIHNVFESAPTVAEAARDVADLLTEAGALGFPVQVLSTSGDGGALAIGLRALLHTIHRRSRLLITVLVNEVFANTGFQVSPAAIPFSETSTTPVGRAAPGNLLPPLDYLHLAIAAGADFVAQVSPAHGGLFQKTVEKGLATPGTAVLFVPSPCISGWKFEDGETIALAQLGARAGVFPVFIWERGKGGQIRQCERDAAARPPIEDFLGAQRRFGHLVERDPATGAFRARPNREPEIAKLRTWVQENVERLYGLAALK